MTENGNSIPLQAEKRESFSAESVSYVVSDPASQRPKEQTATLRRFSTNRATLDPAPLSAFTVNGNSEWETPGCRESVSNGEMEGEESSEPGSAEGVPAQASTFVHMFPSSVFFLSICTPEGIYCQDIDCRGRH